MSIRDESIKWFKRRVDEIVSEGRNKVRVIIGTDRKNTIDSGYGSGGANDKESGAYIVTVGGDEEDLNLTEDDVVLFLSGKSDPDDYFAVDMGAEKKEASLAALSAGGSGHEHARLGGDGAARAGGRFDHLPGCRRPEHHPRPDGRAQPGPRHAVHDRRLRRLEHVCAA